MIRKALIGISLMLGAAGLVLLVQSCGNKNTAAGNEGAATAEAHQHRASADSASTPAKKPLSPHTNAMGNIGGVHVHVDYSSPSVRGRTIWGGLVAYDQVWSAGAHNATSIDFSKDVVIDGKPVPAGKYGFFTIPGRETWTLILNRNYDQHLADEYDPAEDVLRWQVRPETLSTPVGALTYKVEPTGAEGRIALEWERLRIAFPVREQE